MRAYGKPNKVSSLKIHSSDKCDICSNVFHKIIKARERRKNKLNLNKNS